MQTFYLEEPRFLRTVVMLISKVHVSFMHRTTYDAGSTGCPCDGYLVHACLTQVQASAASWQTPEASEEAATVVEAATATFGHHDRNFGGRDRNWGEAAASDLSLHASSLKHSSCPGAVPLT